MSFNKIYNSPIIMTWAGMIGKIGNSLIILPIVLKLFPLEILNIWFLFQIFYSLKDTLDLGLVNNISRFFSYALGGVKDFNNLEETDVKPNINLIKKINSVSHRLYLIIAIIALLFYFSIGSFFLYKPINNDITLWYSWIFVIFSTVIALYGNKYSSILIGLNRVAVLRRTDAILGVISLITSAIIVIVSKDFLLLIISFYGAYILITIKNYYLYKKLTKDYEISSVPFSANTWNKIKEVAKKSFLGGLMGYGLNQGLKILIANIVPTNISANYLLADRLVGQIYQVAIGPFNSKLPQMTIFESQNKRHELFTLSRKLMWLSYGVVVMGVVLILFFSDAIFRIIKINTDFVSSEVWVLLGISILIERYVIMHQQLYTVISNKIIAHRVIPVTGVFKVIIFYTFFPYIGIVALPLALVLSFMIFEFWYSSYLVFKAVGSNFMKIENVTFIPSLLIIIVSYLICLI